MRKKLMALLATLGCVVGLSLTGFTAPAQAAYTPTPLMGSWDHPYSINSTPINWFYIADNTSSVWPVSASIQIWNDYFAVNHMNIRVAKSYNNMCSDSGGYFGRCTYAIEDDEHSGNLGDTYYHDLSISGNTNVEDTEGYGTSQYAMPWYCSFESTLIVFHDGNVITSPQWAVARENVVTHELGHYFGLGHDINPNDLMYPTMDESSTFANVTRVPSAANIIQLNDAYRNRSC